MIEVDILLIKQIELKYLSKIKITILLAVGRPRSSNIKSAGVTEIQTSRATVMNYIKIWQDARLINMVYPKGEMFPKKPAKIMMHNTNLMYSIYPVKVEEQDVLETFRQYLVERPQSEQRRQRDLFPVDEKLHFRICSEHSKVKSNPNVYYAMHKMEWDTETRYLYGCSVSCIDTKKITDSNFILPNIIE